MTLNPFRRAAGHTPPEFAGRQEPLNTFTNILRRTEIGAISRGMMLYGLRGMGKTVLLRRLQEDAKRAGWVNDLSRKRNGEECIYSSSHPPG